HESALHRLMAKDDEADARAQLAAEHAGLSHILSRLSPGIKRSYSRDNESDDQPYYPHRGNAPRHVRPPSKLRQFLLGRNFVDDYAETAARPKERRLRVQNRSCLATEI